MDSATKALALRKLVAENAKRALAYRAESQSGLARKGPGAHQTTIGRLIAGERNFTIGSLAALAAGLGYEPWQLLVPGFDPRNPPTVIPPDLRAKLKNL